MTSIREEELLTKTISFLRFPLIIAVLFIHTNLCNVTVSGTHFVGGGEFPIHDVVRHIISKELGGIAVPLFFLISGFLFFYNSDFSVPIYKKKIKKRFYTLFIPYIFWNLAILLVFFLTQTFLSSLTSGTNKAIIDYNIFDFLKVFWDYGETRPICFQFWYIRDLIVVVIFSPLIYLAIKKCKIYFIILLALLWYLKIWPNAVGFSSTAFLYFSIGAYFAINKINIVTYLKPYRNFIITFYMIILTTSILLHIYNVAFANYIHLIGMFTGCFAFITLTSIGIENNVIKENKFLTENAFFIYAIHGMPIALLVKLYVTRMQSMSEIKMIAGYLIIPIIITIIGILTHQLLRKLFPRFTNIITGGR